MYGSDKAYARVEGDSQTVLTKGRHKLTIHREKGNVWLKAETSFPEGKITEFLLCECETSRRFRLTSRQVDGRISITLVARRHGQFPANSLVRM